MTLTTKQVLHDNQLSVESMFAWEVLEGIDLFDSRKENVAEVIN